MNLNLEYILAERAKFGVFVVCGHPNAHGDVGLPQIRSEHGAIKERRTNIVENAGEFIIVQLREAALES